VSYGERSVTVENRLGLHARPAAELVKLAAKFESEITISKDEMAVNGKSILGVMTLAAECGSVLLLKAEGADAERAVEELAKLLAHNYQEE
jgi:phosphocarrier protein